MRSHKQKRPWIVLILASIIVLLVAEPAFTAPSQIDDREQGLRLLNLKRYQEAEKRFNQILKVNPSDPKAYHLRGMARLYQNNQEGATKDFQKALKLTPTDTNIMVSMGKVYFQSGQTGKAIKILDQAVKANPKNYKAINQLAWILAVTPQKNIRNGIRAVMLAKRLIAKEENVHTLDTLAAAYAANKEYKKAVSTQEKALAILMKQSLTSEIDPYMERLKTYQKNQSWQHQTSAAKLLAKTKDKPSSTKTATTDKPKVEKPVTKTAVKEKPVAKPQPAERAEVVEIDPIVPKIPLVTKKRSPSLMGKKRLKSSDLQDKPSPPFYPYTIQIASFRDRQKAFYIANYLRQKGDPVFTGPVTLETSGKWYRVLFGWHTNEEKAHKQLTDLKERQFREPAVVKRPYAVLITSTKDMNQLERIERRLKELGQVPYRLADRKRKGYWRMLVGTYSDKVIPAEFAETLRQNGIQPEMVAR